MGACARLLPDGSIEPADEVDAKGKLNGAGGVVQGVDCFLAGLGLPTSYFLPSRAWGALIDRRFYEEISLDYPAGEHEDLPHTCFLYYLAGRVQYVNSPIVNYRFREDSISNAAWTAERVSRYEELWKNFKRNLARFGLSRYAGDSALHLISHMMWRIQKNSANEHH